MGVPPAERRILRRGLPDGGGAFARPEVRSGGTNELAGIRLIDHGTEPAVEEEIPVTTADSQSGIERQAWVRLGTENRNLSERLRSIWLRGCTGELLRLATNLPPAEASFRLRRRCRQCKSGRACERGGHAASSRRLARN